MEQISDQEWMEANLDPQLYRPRLGVAIPNLPPDEVQLRFTGRTGRDNLQQAFDFYEFVLAHLPNLSQGSYDLLDFGGGWGRILRFFLREFRPERLLLADCLAAAIECARSLKPPFSVLQTGLEPPLAFKKTSIGVCYAFSVFSHLSEQGCTRWMQHLGELLVPGGKLIITTRGQAHIDYLSSLVQAQTPYPVLQLLPNPGTIRRLYETGEFQFYPVGGGGELSKDVYGETWIPEPWLRDRRAALGFSSCEFYPEFKTVDQCVFVLTK